MQLHNLIPFAAGFVYALAALTTKRAIQEGAGITRILFVTHWIAFILLLPLLATGSEVIDWGRWWSPFITAVFEFIGAVLIIISIRTGAISIQTPLMGTKVLFVATFTLFLVPGPIPIQWWIGAFLTFFGVLTLGLPDVLNRLASLKSMFFTLASAAFFALTDVLIEVESPKFGKSAFLLTFMFFLALFVLALVPFFTKDITKTPAKTWKWLFAAGFFTALQLVALIYTICFFGEATVVNILYASRGFWCILLIWFVGHWFGNAEKNAGIKVMLRRFLGATLLFAAIVVILR